MTINKYSKGKVELMGFALGVGYKNLGGFGIHCDRNQGSHYSSSKGIQLKEVFNI